MNETAEVPTEMDEDRPKGGKDAIRQWQERISLAKKSLEDWARKDGADRIVQEYNGKFELFFNGLKGKIPVPPINEIFAYVQADIAHTYNRDPYFCVNPKSGTVKGAKLQELRLNYYWRHLRLKDEVELEIIDKDLTGAGWHKVGWEVESDGAEEDLRIVHESLYSKRVDWKDIVWNLGAERVPNDCVWMAQRIVKPLSYVKKKYKNANGRWPLKGVPCPDIDKESYQNANYKDDISQAVIWEVWDKETRTRFLLAEGLNGRYLEDPVPWPDYVEDFPFVMYWDFFSPGKRRPMSAIIPWEPQLHEKMVLMAAAVNHAKRWNRQMLVKKGTISGNDLDKIERGDDGAIIDYTGAGDLDKNLKFMEWGSVPTDYYLIMDRLSAISRDVSGQPEFERGGVTKTTSRTEGELQMIRQGAKGRQDRKVDRFESHLETIARLMLAHLNANFDFEEAVRISGATPQEVLDAVKDHIDPVSGMVKFQKEDIKGEYEVEIKIGSTLPLNKEGKSAALKDVLAVIGAVQGAAGSPLVRTVIGEYLDLFDIKSLDEAFAQEQQMAQEQAARQQQEVSASDIKARTQGAKNVAQMDKINVEAEKLRQEVAGGGAVPPMAAPDQAGGVANGVQ